MRLSPHAASGAGRAFASPLSLEGRDAWRLAGLLTCCFIRSPSSQTFCLRWGSVTFWALSATTVAGPSLRQIVKFASVFPESFPKVRFMPGAFFLIVLSTIPAIARLRQSTV
jgi:hypothetical protein